jgi:serine/threonine-protein kinase HipA
MDEYGNWRLSPAYDITYIFNSGGYLPETQHCLMIRGKFTDITIEDVVQLATENGIRRPESIIREVAEAIQGFRTLAEKYGVEEQWIAAVETTLKANIEAWHLTQSSTPICYTDEFGRKVENIRIEQQFKGNYHLLATIDGKERKYVIRKKTTEHDEISRLGPSALSDQYLRSLVSQFLK